MLRDNIFLIGFMGAGKSSVGRRLADVLDKGFYDSDREIERRVGTAIGWIFDLEGEAGFRARERDMITELAGKKDIVLATGGGAVLDESLRKVLAERGFMVYLRASPETLSQRIGRDKTRPLLGSEQPMETVRQLLAQREALYQGLADVIVDTDELAVKDVVREIRKHHTLS